MQGGGGVVPHYMPCSNKEDARDGYSVNTEMHLKICQTSIRKFFQFVKIFNLLQIFDTSCSLLHIKFIASVKKSSHQMQPVLFTLANLICQGWVGEICLKTKREGGLSKRNPYKKQTWRLEMGVENGLYPLSNYQAQDSTCIY